MGETTSVSNSALQVSVSFGRFEKESLSWEKWSSFSPNKYLEEVEKCATPGSVAQKKAYFEAHYKKIAARKAELLAQEKEAKEESFESEDQNCLDLSNKSCGINTEFNISNTQDSFEGVKHETGSFGEISRTELDNLEEEISVSRDCQRSLYKGENEGLDYWSHSSGQFHQPEANVCIKQEESVSIEVEDVKEISHVVYKEKEKSSQVVANSVKLDHPKEHKVITKDRESIRAKTKKKSMLPTAKASQLSTPRSSKPTSTRKGGSPSLSRRPFTSGIEIRKFADKSLHMSPSLGQSNPGPAPHSIIRKSSIDEKVEGKDIIKRSLKSFQNNSNLPKTYVEDRSQVKKQVPYRGAVSKVPASTALRKENGQPSKVDSVDKRIGNSVRTTMGPKRDLRADKGKESSRKTKEKTNAKDVESSSIQSKLKEEKEAGMKKLKRNLKATPPPAFYRGQKVTHKREMPRLRTVDSPTCDIRKER